MQDVLSCFGREFSSFFCNNLLVLFIRYNFAQVCIFTHIMCGTLKVSVSAQRKESHGIFTPRERECDIGARRVPSLSMIPLQTR